MPFLVPLVFDGIQIADIAAGRRSNRVRIVGIKLDIGDIGDLVFVIGIYGPYIFHNIGIVDRIHFVIAVLLVYAKLAAYNQITDFQTFAYIGSYQAKI